ncbi:hypothetical protein GOBAR_AA28005 [Gossypium barbadense]|uniref:Cytochrome P450 n=1 Tax=Gossypium barbadense TaxID=3634 RepID=A0A2P5WNK5_GOSBA|nr:hypothetical protein GOBAR_AA28005 [Gossypium barbadense]
MELLNVAQLSTNPLFLSLILLFSLLVWLQLEKRKTLNLPPSPPKLPLIGDIHQLGKLPHRSLRDLSKKYGSLLLLQLGYNPTFLVSSADMVREIVKNHDIDHCCKIFFYKCKDMACAPYGDYWRQVKKMSFVQHFSNQSVQSFQFIRDEEVELLINKIRSVCLKGESIYLIDMLMSVSSNIVSRCVLSHKSEEDGRSKLGELGKRLLILFNSLCVGDMFPYLRWVDVLTGLIPSMKAVSAELDAFLDQVIQEHKALESYVKKNFLSIIMQLQKNGTFEMDLAQENIKAYCVKLEGYDIPSNTKVLINAWAIQRDPKWWENPEEFIPERFENSSIDFKGQDFQLNPFDFGKRRCPRIAFGVASIEFVMANLLYWFDWKLPAGETTENMDIAELYGLTVI